MFIKRCARQPSSTMMGSARPYICLVISKGQDHVLVDTGAGNLAPTTGRLIPNLEAEGISPEDIGTVILTHGHPDHIGGNIDCEGKPAFPNARYVMWKDEWDFWTSDPDLLGLKIDDHGKEILVKVAQNNLHPIRDQLERARKGKDKGVRVETEIENTGSARNTSRTYDSATWRSRDWSSRLT